MRTETTPPLYLKIPVLTHGEDEIFVIMFISAYFD
ncbi:MAG: hypothetical protein K0R23_3754 [Lacrimispora sp.]|jgi:hypothetical protein|nr:hypothetical protein [Lacrimispora sp.]